MRVSLDSAWASSSVGARGLRASFHRHSLVHRRPTRVHRHALRAQRSSLRLPSIDAGSARVVDPHVEVCAQQLAFQASRLKLVTARHIGAENEEGKGGEQGGKSFRCANWYY